jgi:hypothetical protein
MTTTHLVAVEVDHAIVGRCRCCGQLVLGATRSQFDAAVTQHQADEADAEIEASRMRHPSAKRIHEPMATPLLNRWST